MNSSLYQFLLLSALILPSKVLLAQNTPDQQRSRSYNDSARITVAVKDYDKGIKFATSAIVLDKQNHEPYLTRAAIYSLIGDHNSAVNDYSTYIIKNPGIATTYLYRADAYADIKNHAKAFSDYNKAISLSKAPKDISMAYYRRALLKVELLDWVGALKDCNKSIALNKIGTPLAYSLRADIHANNGNLAGVIEDSNNAIQLSEGEPAYHDYLRRGIAKAKSGNTESGCLDINKANELRPTEKGMAATKQYCR